MWDRSSQRADAWIAEHVMGEEMIDLLPGEMGFMPLGTTTMPGRYVVWPIDRESGDAKHILRPHPYTSQEPYALRTLEKFMERNTHFVRLERAGAHLAWECDLIPKIGEKTMEHTARGRGTFCWAICQAIYNAIVSEGESSG